MTTTHFEWAFGGWMATLPAWLQWLLLALLATGGGAVILWSYRQTLSPLPPVRRRVLVALRLVFLIGLLALLANPARVERKQIAEPVERTLAVLVDQSTSMHRPDNRSQTRLDQAAREWAKIQPAARAHFSALQYAGFSGAVRSAGSLEEAMKGATSPETRLIQSLADTLKKAPSGGFGAVVTLTDGLDTTEESANELVNLALAAQTPLYFVVGENRQRSEDKLRIREIQAPGEVLQRTAFDFQAVVESYSETARTVPARLLQDGKVIAESQLEIPQGPGVTLWKNSVNAGEPGKLALEIQIGEPATAKIAKREVRVVRQMRVSILYYQGALDWGYRFLQNIFRRDPSYEISSILNPQLGTKLRTGSQQLEDLPETARELQGFSVVILDSVFANQLSEAQQKALEDYVRDGGAILFIAHDTAATQAFAGSRLESILPIVFGRLTAADQATRSADRFRDQMRTAASAAAPNGATPPDESVVELRPFSFPENSPLKPLLTKKGANGRPEPIVPRFAESADVARSKPGATVLGVHPTARDAEGNPKILLAVQRFGKGRVAALATDSLWRWKMSLPSESMDPSVFWQQFTLWLAGSASRGLKFVEHPVEVTVGRSISLLIASNEAPQVTARLGDQPPVPLEVKPDGERGQWRVAWRPDQIGEWALSASAGNSESRISIHAISADDGGPDGQNLPPDFERLRELADATGGEILQRGAPAAWLAPVEQKGLPPLPESRTLLWNRWPILLALLAVYAVELLLRRLWRLL